MRVNLAYALAKYLVAKRPNRGRDTATSGWGVYGDWRTQELRREFCNHFGPSTAIGKDVLDFGCGDGALCMILAEAGAHTVHGIDLDEAGLKRFAERLRDYSGAIIPTFSRSKSPTRVDRPDRSCDAIYCFDVLEHIIAYRAIIPEWRRVLRPGGSVYISWQPYWHPFGHHSYDWVPIPWAHVLLRDDQFTEVCARIVESPEFDAPIWDRNPDGSLKNRFRAADTNGNFLNKLTTHEFKKVCRAAEFSIARCEFHPFNGPPPVKLVSATMTKLPLLRDFFTAIAIYELRAPS